MWNSNFLLNDFHFESLPFYGNFARHYSISSLSLPNKFTAPFSSSSSSIQAGFEVLSLPFQAPSTQDNQTYMVHNREALLYDMSLKVCDNKYKLFFNCVTTITTVDIPTILVHCLHFKPFVDFLQGHFIVDRLYDVIGVVQQVVRTQVAGAEKQVVRTQVAGAEKKVGHRLI
ncbi:unnamed protein product [Vicia faba]|uniref:Uncharacterized protein n=1 Tax=Vicia faba TaxID=3906 RepID=A0AAV1AK59_VICFA|nr:unnamed protein product [Vicia faba]